MGKSGACRSFSVPEFLAFRALKSSTGGTHCVHAQYGWHLTKELAPMGDELSPARPPGRARRVAELSQVVRRRDAVALHLPVHRGAAHAELARTGTDAPLVAAQRLQQALRVGVGLRAAGLGR